MTEQAAVAFELADVDESETLTMVEFKVRPADDADVRPSACLPVLPTRL